MFKRGKVTSSSVRDFVHQVRRVAWVRPGYSLHYL